MKGLTGKQEAFVDHYCGDAQFNATLAARLAGYSGSEKALTARGAENVAKRSIAAEIKKRRSNLAARCEVQAKDVIAELKGIAFADLTEYLDEGSLVRGRIKLSDWRKLTKAQRAAVAEVGEIPGRKGGRCLRFKLHNKLDALEKLCRYLGLFERDNEQKGAKTVIVFQNSQGKTILSNETGDS